MGVEWPELFFPQFGAGRGGLVKREEFQKNVFYP